MAVQTFPLHTQRVGRFKGMTLAHAIPREALSRVGDMHQIPRNRGDNIGLRRWIPAHGATATDHNTQNRFFQDMDGDRARDLLQANRSAEGVTPAPTTLTPVDIWMTLVQYSCLYGITDRVRDLYEDDVFREMSKQTGERMALVNEMIVYAELKGCLNQFYAGASANSLATTSGVISMNLLGKIQRNLQANHAMMTNRMLRNSAAFGTEGIHEAYTVFCHTDMEQDLAKLPGFRHVYEYPESQGTMPGEYGSAQRFRFVTSPELVSQQNAGSNVAVGTMQSQGGSNIDVYRFVVLGDHAFGQTALRGEHSFTPYIIPVGRAEKADPLAQRGYVGCKWYKAATPQNDGWMAIGNCGVSKL